MRARKKKRRDFTETLLCEKEDLCTCETETPRCVFPHTNFNFHILQFCFYPFCPSREKGILNTKIPLPWVDRLPFKAKQIFCVCFCCFLFVSLITSKRNMTNMSMCVCVCQSVFFFKARELGIFYGFAAFSCVQEV